MAQRQLNFRLKRSYLPLLFFFLFFISCNNKEEREPDGFIYKPKTTKPAEAKPVTDSLKIEPQSIASFTGKVIGIKDGDTFEVLFNGKPERIRLLDIDCPENSQPFGKAAKQYASDLCFGKTVRVTGTGKRDRYGRIVATIITAEGINVNKELVNAGLAWHYKAYSKNADYAILENAARFSKKGLWADKKPIAPWKWRKMKKSDRIKASK